MTETREAISDRQFPGDSATIRVAAVALPLGAILALIVTAIHPHREDVMDNPAVFTEYAQSSHWVAIHFAQWFAAMLLFVGMLGVYHAIKQGSAIGKGIARFGLFATVQAAAAITGLQAVDGVALKWATEAWVSAPADDKPAAFAAAEALRWTEYGFQSYFSILLGLALVLLGLATAVGTAHRLWVGGVGAASGIAWIIHGVMVPYVGLFDSTPRLIGMVLLIVWSFIMAFLMWRNTGRLASSRPSPTIEPTPPL
jgi:hypothetical protein